MAARAARAWLALALLAALAWLFGTGPVAAAAASEDGSAPVTLVLFHGDGCPHCAAEREFLQELAGRHPDLVIEQYEVWYDEANRAKLDETAERLGFEATGVPVTVIGERVWIGFDDAKAEAIEQTVEAALAGDSKALEPTASTSMEVPFLGTVDLGGTSLLVSTLVIGFVDGVNPCSLWVLSVLLAIVLHSGSRGRVILVGSTFLFVTTAMYALYIVGFYSALDYVGEMVWIRLGLAAIAITFGVLQLKDGLYPGHGPSLSISAEHKPGLYKKMRGVAAADRGLPAVIAGTVALAVGVSLLETPCTAGLPLLWTGLLSEQGVSTGAAAGLFAIYMTVFLLDELIVFAVAVFTLRAAKLQERHGRLLKLIAGSVLLTLGVTMLVAPQAMDTLTGTLVVFGAAAVLTLALWLVAVRPGQSVTRASTKPS
jgi:cytochrome c biogenesis protein CcdA/glutaredoxin